jgi:hypothetical protein
LLTGVPTPALPKVRCQLAIQDGRKLIPQD